ncbi:MAG: hypothetical protein MJZ68_09370 [archaeon]|nr:hypothetical protein [archaeon]
MWFFIDNFNKQDVESRLYGYTVTGKGVVEDPISGPEELTPEGTYIYIHSTEDKVDIYQDFLGCFGLYVYSSGNYTAISNSFAYLLEKLDSKLPLTINKEYCDYLLNATICVNSAYETPVKEIRLLDRHSVFTFFKNDNRTEEKIIDYREGTVEPGSEEGLKILDSWHRKWTNLIGSMCASDCSMLVELSGGFDSRISLGLFLDSGADMSRVIVRSLDTPKHAEDFKYASAIAEHYGLKLNGSRSMTTQALPFEDTFENSLYIKLGTSKRINFRNRVTNRRRYAFTGSGTTKGIWQDLDGYIEKELGKGGRFGGKYSSQMKKSIKAVINRSVDGIIERHPAKNRESRDIGTLFYWSTRARFHYGKSFVENYMTGSFSISPSIDHELRMLKTDGMKLTAMIYTRFFKELMEFGFESGRAIPEKYMEYAETADREHPFQRTPIELTPIQDMTYRPLDRECPALSETLFRNCIERMARSDAVKSAFMKLYPADILKQIYVKCKSKKHDRNGEYIGIVSLAKVQKTVNEHSVRKTGILASLEGMCEPLNLPIRTGIKKNCLARIDIRNEGPGSDISVVHVSDTECKIDNPDWFKNGKGRTFTSNKGTLTVVFSAVNDGTLHISLRTPNSKDKDGNKVKRFIEYTQMMVNGNPILDHEKTVWHDEPFRCKLKVINKQIIELSIDWKPCCNQ